MDSKSQIAQLNLEPGIFFPIITELRLGTFVGLGVMRYHPPETSCDHISHRLLFQSVSFGELSSGLWRMKIIG